MDIPAAHVSQIVRAADGKLYELSAESCTVAADLAAIDKGLKVSFSERGECYVVRHEWHDGCPHNADVGPGGSYLVLTAKAHRGRSGVWQGLDERVVQRIQQIDPQGRSGYDFVRELELRRIREEEKQRREFEEWFGPVAEQTAYALRRDLGERYKGRATPWRYGRPAHALKR